MRPPHCGRKGFALGPLQGNQRVAKSHSATRQALSGAPPFPVLHPDSVVMKPLPSYDWKLKREQKAARSLKDGTGMTDRLKSGLRAFLSRYNFRGECGDYDLNDTSAWRPPLAVRIAMFMAYVISQGCTLFFGGVRVFIVYPIGLLVFGALVVAAIDSDVAPDVTLVSGIYEIVTSSIQGAPSGQINLYKCADPAVPIDKGASICQHPIVTAVPLSEGIPILAAKLTDMLRAFYVLSVILVLGAMMMSAKWLTRNDKLLKGAIGKLSPAVGATASCATRVAE